jgi:hypothetical protein
MTTTNLRETLPMQTHLCPAEAPSRLQRATVLLSLLAASLVLGACDNTLEVQYPGRIPVDQVNNPDLAPTLAAGVVGDLECAYNNYVAGSAFHSDEFEASNDNGYWSSSGERGITGDNGSYASSPCEGTDFGLQVPMHTARYQSEDVFNRLAAWTDAEVPNRVALQSKVRAYGAYAYTFLGETYCKVAFDGGELQDPAVSLAKAAERFADAIRLANQGNGSDKQTILSMSQVGLARVNLDLKKWSDAAAAAALVPVGFELFADRGTESDRRYNKVYFAATQSGAFVIADAYRTMDDPRVPIEDTGRGAFNPSVDLWIQTKHPDLGSPIRLASYFEARLILAEAKVELGDIPGAMQILNARRTQLGLSTYPTNPDKTTAIASVLAERQRELSFEGGHRLNDLLRRNITWKASGTENPYTGRPYGVTTCWPVPSSETGGV